MVAVPGATAVTTPVVASTDATELLLLLHEPPVVASVNVVVLGVQRVDAPLIGKGVGLLTTIVAVLLQEPFTPLMNLQKSYYLKK